MISQTPWPGKPPITRRVLDQMSPHHWFGGLCDRTPPVPAYLFHQPVPDHFTSIAQAVRRSQCATVTTDDVLDRAGSLTPERSVWLTFDDGWSSVWSVAFPIAKRYGLRFTAFICPELIEESDECRTTIESGLDPDEARQRDSGPRGRLTWGELKQMSQSGLGDVQSHSLNHGLVFWSPDAQISPRDVDLALRSGAPILQRSGGRDVLLRRPAVQDVGHPLGPALAVERRYLEAEGRWESDEERRRRFCEDLSGARRMLESRLSTRVRALAPPWALMHRDLPAVAAETGHELLVMGFPFTPLPAAPIPVHPRLKGDAVWFAISNSMTAPARWLVSMSNSRRLASAGGVP